MKEENNFMVLFADIESGEIREVYASNKLGEISDVAGNLKENDAKKQQVFLDRSTCIITHYSENSPGCRYVKVGSSWRVVCTS